VQVKVLENHQNGKDTHIRGLKIYSRDERIGRGRMTALDGLRGKMDLVETKIVVSPGERGWITEPTWMGEVELR